MALRVAPPPLADAAPEGPTASPERALADQRARGMPGGMSVMEHLRQAGQHILEAARQSPAVAQSAGEIVGLITKVTEAAMAPAEGAEGSPMPSQPPMPGPPEMTG